MSRVALYRDERGEVVVRRFADEAEARRAGPAALRAFREVRDEAQTPGGVRSQERDDGVRGVAVLAAPARVHGLGAPTSRPAWPVSRVARELGVHPRTITRRCVNGELPFVDHGTADRGQRFIPAGVVELIRVHGLRGVAAMMRAGML